MLVGPHARFAASNPHPRLNLLLRRERAAYACKRRRCSIMLMVSERPNLINPIQATKERSVGRDDGTDDRSRRGSRHATKHLDCSPRKGDAWPWMQWRSIMVTNCNNKPSPHCRLLPPFRGEEHISISASVSRTSGGVQAPRFYLAFAPVGAMRHLTNCLPFAPGRRNASWQVTPAVRLSSSAPSSPRLHCV